MSDIQKEGVVAFVFVNEPGRVIIDRIGVEELLGLVFGVGVGGDQGILPSQGIRVEETARSVNRTVEPVETPLPRPIVLGGTGMNLRGHVPFPGKISRILRGLQNLGDSLHIASEIALVSGESGVVHHMSDSRLMWVSSGQ